MFNFKKGINDFSSIMLLQQKQTGGSIYYSEEKIKSINWDEHDHWIDISFIEDQEAHMEEIKRSVKASNGSALILVRDQTEELCKFAIDLEPRSIKFIRDQTESLCKYALIKAKEKDKIIMDFIRDQTEELCKFAIDLDDYNFLCIRNKTEEICKYILDKKDTGHYLLYMDQTYAICKYAICKDPANLIYIINPSLEMEEFAVSMDPLRLIDIRNQTLDLCKIAIEKDPNSVGLIRFKEIMKGE